MKMKFTDEQIKVTTEKTRRQEYVKRIIAAVNYQGTDDHEDVPSILRKYEKENLDIINRQEAEITELKTDVDYWKRQAYDGCMRAGDREKEIERLKSMNQAKLDMIHDLQTDLETTQSKTIKEFVEKVDTAAENISKLLSSNFDEFMAAKKFLKALRSKIRHIAKEMVGEK